MRRKRSDGWGSTQATQQTMMLRSLVIGVMTSAPLTTTAWAQGQFGT
jgi:hypothetical protein